MMLVSAAAVEPCVQEVVVNSLNQNLINVQLGETVVVHTLSLIYGFRK